MGSKIKGVYMLLLQHVIKNRRKKPIVVPVIIRDYINSLNEPLTVAALKQKLTETDYTYTVGVQPR